MESDTDTQKARGGSLHTRRGTLRAYDTAAIRTIAFGISLRKVRAEVHGAVYGTLGGPCKREADVARFAPTVVPALSRGASSGCLVLFPVVLADGVVEGA